MRRPPFSLPWKDGLDVFAQEGRTGITVACISAEYQGKRLGTYISKDGVPEMGAVEEPAIAYITLLSPPASVKLEQPEGGLYHTDNGGNGKDITLSWTADDLDVENGGGQFELYIAGGALENPISETDLKGGVTQDGDTHSYTLHVQDVKPDIGAPTSYRDSYIISPSRSRTPLTPPKPTTAMCCMSTPRTFWTSCWTTGRSKPMAAATPCPT
ncbi:hypothetical protein I4100191B2_26560 [Clostridiales bacterium]